ncbi:unnamed protein product, partial [Urochloa humidicola]
RNHKACSFFSGWLRAVPGGSRSSGLICPRAQAMGPAAKGVGGRHWYVRLIEVKWCEDEAMASIVFTNRNNPSGSIVVHWILR